MDPVEPRDPESGDLLRICQALNDKGARYIVIGGMALVYYGFHRGTEDIDLLVDRTAGNISKLKESLSILPDNAVSQMRASDLETYGTVRIADEVVVDLMSSACGIDFAEASSNLRQLPLIGSVGEHFIPGFGDQNHVFDSATAEAMVIKAGLHRDHMTCPEPGIDGGNAR